MLSFNDFRIDTATASEVIRIKLVLQHAEEGQKAAIEFLTEIEASNNHIDGDTCGWRAMLDQVLVIEDGVFLLGEGDTLTEKIADGFSNDGLTFKVDGVGLVDVLKAAGFKRVWQNGATEEVWFNDADKLGIGISGDGWDVVMEVSSGLWVSQDREGQPNYDGFLFGEEAEDARKEWL